MGRQFKTEGKVTGGICGLWQSDCVVNLKLVEPRFIDHNPRMFVLIFCEESREEAEEASERPNSIAKACGRDGEGKRGSGYGAIAARAMSPRGGE